MDKLLTTYFAIAATVAVVRYLYLAQVSPNQEGFAPAMNALGYGCGWFFYLLEFLVFLYQQNRYGD